jgi:hypothetical protein
MTRASSPSSAPEPASPTATWSNDPRNQEARTERAHELGPEANHRVSSIAIVMAGDAVGRALLVHCGHVVCRDRDARWHAEAAVCATPVGTCGRTIRSQ